MVYTGRQAEMQHLAQVCSARERGSAHLTAVGGPAASELKVCRDHICQHRGKCIVCSCTANSGWGRPYTVPSPGPAAGQRMGGVLGCCVCVCVRAHSVQHGKGVCYKGSFFSCSLSHR